MTQGDSKLTMMHTEQETITIKQEIVMETIIHELDIDKMGSKHGDMTVWGGGGTTFRALRDQMDIRTQVRRQTITDTEMRPTSLRTLRTSDKDRHGNIGRQEYKEDSKVKILHNKTLNTKY